MLMATTSETGDAAVTDEKQWEDLVKNSLRAEMMRRGVSYGVLVERLASIGIFDNEINLRNKVSRGRFTAVFLLQCLRALEVEWIQIPAMLSDASKPPAKIKGEPARKRKQ